MTQHEADSYINIFETICKERPPLFAGISRILMATENPRKIKAFNNWLTDMHLINGSQELAAQPRGVGGEAAWDSAVQVSRDKVEQLIQDIKGEPGGQTLCFGSDVVFWLGEKPLLNLSRKNDLNSQDLQEAVSELQRIFTDPVVARWDVALSLSRKSNPGKIIKATLADSIRVHYDPIPGDIIQELFYEDIPGALGRNTRIPLIDDPRLQEYIQEIEILPIQALVEPQTGSLRDHNLSNVTGWTWCCGAQGFDSIRNVVTAEIVGGLPRRKRLDELLHLQARKEPRWQLL